MWPLSYLSPTSIMLWESDREEFYLQKLAPVAPPRMPQTQPMAIGSSFDAYVKSYLYRSLYGGMGDIEEFEYVDSENQRVICSGASYAVETLLLKQVEPSWRDWGRVEGLRVLGEYVASGGAANVVRELADLGGKGRFEFEVRGDVMYRDEGIVPLLGKPDVWIPIKDTGRGMVLDYKVNGYCSPRPTSPKKGYCRCVSSDDRRGTVHKDCASVRCMSEVDKGWATQLAIYSFLMGAEVGREDIPCGIEQVCGSGGSPLRFASHRHALSRGWQLDVMARAWRIWDCVGVGREDYRDRVFRDLGMSGRESRARCEMLDDKWRAYGLRVDSENLLTAALGTCDSLVTDWFAGVDRVHKGF